MSNPNCGGKMSGSIPSVGKCIFYIYKKYLYYHCYEKHGKKQFYKLYTVPLIPIIDSFMGYIAQNHHF